MPPPQCRIPEAVLIGRIVEEAGTRSAGIYARPTKGCIIGHSVGRGYIPADHAGPPPRSDRTHSVEHRDIGGEGKPPPYEGAKITAVPGPLWEGAVTK